MEEYKVGDKFYLVNRRTNETKEVEIIGLKYVFSSKIGSTDTLTSDQIQNEISQGRLMASEREYRDMRIKQLEQELGIKLKEV